MTATSSEIRLAEKELLNLMLCMAVNDPADRPTAQTALKHSFLTTKI